MSKKKKKRNKRHNSPLSSHTKKGSTLVPPLMSIGNISLQHWLQNELPNMLWLTYMCSTYREEGMVLARQFFDCIEEVFLTEYPSIDKVPQDVPSSGSLISLEAVPERFRLPLITKLKERGLYDTLFTRNFRIAMSQYKDSPGGWILELGALGKIEEYDMNTAREQLSKTIDESWSGRNEVSTWAKMAYMSSVMSRGRMYFNSGTMEEVLGILMRYPVHTTLDENKRAESFMRASYGAVTTQEDESKKISWAKNFWRSNWIL